MFDLSECGVKEVPSGVFVLCKVLRKEQLLLSKNLLKNLHHGGALEDLYLIQVLDLSHNLLKVVPDLCFLKQLKVGKHLIREFLKSRCVEIRLGGSRGIYLNGEF